MYQRKIKHLCFTVLGVAAFAVAAQDAPQPLPQQPPPPQEKKSDSGMQLSPQEMETMKRRYEIMILIQAYRIMPEEQRAPIQDEIVKRLKQDYEANRDKMGQIIVKMEKDLQNLKERLDDRNSEAVVQEEFKRLLEAPIGGMGPRGWMGPPPDIREKFQEKWADKGAKEPCACPGMPFAPKLNDKECPAKAAPPEHDSKCPGASERMPLAPPPPEPADPAIQPAK